MKTERRRHLSTIGFFLLAIIAAHLLDGWAYEHLQMPRLAETDLGRMLRILGFLPLWLVIALAIALAEDPDRPWRRRLRRGGMLLGAAASGGIVAEVTKILVRRERPAAGVVGYRFRPFGEETFHTGGLGLPSSHALVAFAGLAALGWLFPRARPLFWLLGAGCAFSRVAAGAHYLSDVVVAAALGAAVAAVWGRRLVAATAGGT